MIGILGDLSVFHMETIVVLGAFHRRNLDSIANLHRFDRTDRHDCLGKNGVQLFKDRISETGRNVFDSAFDDTACAVLILHAFF